MLRILAATCIAVMSTVLFLAGCRQETPHKSPVGSPAPPAQVAMESPDGTRSGEGLFKQYCSSCHPNGGNASDPNRPLYGSALRRNRITTPEDIVRIMRNPLSRMIRFDVSTLSDRDARAIAEYVLTTFK